VVRDLRARRRAASTARTATSPSWSRPTRSGWAACGPTRSTRTRPPGSGSCPPS
jgi:hypothetical protein